MAQLFSLHPQNPQPRLLKQAVSLLRAGGILALPTDTSYALVCQLDDKAAAEALRRIRALDDKRLLALICRDLSELGAYARVDNAQFRLLKLGTPGPFTFIMEASKEVPRRLSHPKRKTIGLRVPDHKVAQALLALYGAPLLATTLILPEATEPLNDAAEIADQLSHQIAGVLEAGACPGRVSTVVDLTGGMPQVVRQGLGDPALLGL
ncbi:MAG: threonylcarbamoyl-AMP synthase [Burkholderiaceae bacterium]|nr:MAG: threonylcarbamoyl-AMP synthase [Burkholderiaceae bacterium]